MELYNQQVSETYQAGSEEVYGSGQITSLEITELRKLVIHYNGDRDAIISHLEEHGWPFPIIVEAKDIGIAAIYHACVVGEYLAQQRGPQGAVETFKSYITKNQCDRFIFKYLPKNLKSTWMYRVKRISDHRNPHVSYPFKVDAKFIHGVAIPFRYFPTQLMKDLEFMRLQGNDLCKIQWRLLIPLIEKATDIYDIPINIALFITHTLLSRGMSIEKVSDIIVHGYDPSGPLLEHGPINETDLIWSSLQLQLFRSQIPNGKEVARLIVDKASAKASEAINQLNLWGNNYTYTLPNLLPLN